MIRAASLSGRGAWRCSGLIRFVRGVLEGLTAKVDAEVPGWWARLRFCCVLLGFGVGAGVDGVKFWQPLSTPVNLVSTPVNLVSTSVKFWQPLARPGLPAWRAGRRRCGERGMVRHSCSGVSVARVEGSGGVRRATVGGGAGRERARQHTSIYPAPIHLSPLPGGD